MKLEDLGRSHGGGAFPGGMSPGARLADAAIGHIVRKTSERLRRLLIRRNRMGKTIRLAMDDPALIRLGGRHVQALVLRISMQRPDRAEAGL